MSESKQPHLAIPQDSRLHSVEIFASGAFTPGDADASAAAAYGIYVESDAYRARISEPLPHLIQTRRRATVKSLFSALELGHCLRARHVTVVLPDERVVAEYHALLRGADTGVDWRRVDDARHWRQVLAIADAYRCRAMTSRVVHAPLADSCGLRKANELAVQGLALHAWCASCRLNYGRPGTNHDCRPVAGGDPCALVRSASLGVHDDRVQTAHSTDDAACPEDLLVRKNSSSILTSICPHCQVALADLPDFAVHVERYCPDLLASWFSQTKIVKV